MVQENFKKVEKANWLKIIFNSARFLISLLVLNIGVVLLFTVEISRNFYVSTVVIFIVLLIILGIADFFVFSYYKKKYPNIYFYDDGFSVGKNEKNYYKNLQYFLSKEVYMVGNTFTAIFFKTNEGKWEKINAGGYKKNSFDLFQEDFVKQNYPSALENIENGGVEIFPFQNQSFVKNKFLFSSEEGLQELTQIFESSPKIQVSNKSVTFDNEIYDWENYNIEFEIGTITVSDLKKNTILEIEAKNTVICQEILLKNLIENFDKKYPKFY